MPQFHDAGEGERLAAAIALSGLLHAITNRMTASGKAAYAHFGLGLLESRLIYVLAKAQPTSAARLAARLAIDPAAVSRAVHRLAECNLLTRASAEQPGLALTPEGLALAERIRTAFDGRCLRLVEGIAIDDLRTVQAVLARVQANLAQVAAFGDEIGADDSLGNTAV